MTIEPFELRVPRPSTTPWLPALEAALAADGAPPVRWAIVAVEGDVLVIEGARRCSP
jgi:hypothetical protein